MDRIRSISISKDLVAQQEASEVRDYELKTVMLGWHQSYF